MFTHRAPGKESNNEDSIALIPCNENITIAAVADGLGGLPAGATASNMAIESLTSLLSKPDAVDNVRDAIMSAFDLANEKILDQGSGSATTLSVVEIENDHIRPYHVGDSVILVTGQRGKLKLQTVSHSPVGYAVEAGLLGERQAIYHHQRHLISNVVGSTDMSIAIGSNIRLARYDTLLIASDGLFDNLYTREVIEIIRKGSMLEAANKLVEKCNSRMLNRDKTKPHHVDDLSFILYRLK